VIFVKEKFNSFISESRIKFRSKWFLDLLIQRERETQRQTNIFCPYLGKTMAYMRLGRMYEGISLWLRLENGARLRDTIIPRLRARELLRLPELFGKLLHLLVERETLLVVGIQLQTLLHLPGTTISYVRNNNLVHEPSRLDQLVNARTVNLSQVFQPHKVMRV